ncbi:MAG: hypothetical protein WBR18_09435, partial [Anaerolineales bacterium]
GSAWAMEWNLARWLGSGFGLAEATQRRLVMANAFGLLALKIDDDLADGELEPLPGTGGLFNLLLAEAENILKVDILQSNPYWIEHQRVLTTWRRRHGSSRTPARRRIDPSGPVLSGAGAPLHLCGRAVCLLSDRSDLSAPVDAVLSHYLSAFVLLDHLKDWPADLRAGRPNTFLEQVVEEDVGVNAAAAAGLAWSAIAGGAAYERYVAAIDHHLLKAMQESERFPAPRLTNYLVVLRHQVSDGAARVRQTADSVFTELQARILA